MLNVHGRKVAAKSFGTGSELTPFFFRSRLIIVVGTYNNSFKGNR